VIPVLICPVLNRFDLLERLLRSVDIPVEQVLIVDNSCSGYTVPPDIALPVGYIRPLTGIGYGGAINQGIMQTAPARWWMWASNDVEFHPGHLQTVAERMDVATSPTIITGGFTWAALNDLCLDAVGLVDEWSFFPIYYDDNDYHRRCDLAGVNWVEDWANGSNHGDGKHPGSMVINSDADIKRKNNGSFVENHQRYLEKWGGIPGQEVYETPWNSGLPLWYTRPEIRARARRMW